MNSIYMTVFTPTYNRAYILNNLYQSLKKQTASGFEWLIVDDGSTDDTEKIVNSWLEEENPFEIIYVKKENGGKPSAINVGVNSARGEFFFIVDSDDYLSETAVEKMTKWSLEIQNNDTFVGAGAARGYPNGNYLLGKAPDVNEYGYIDATNLEREKFSLNADMCEAYKTAILKKFPFETWKGEKFVPEQIVLNEMSLAGYKLRWHSDIIYFCEYLEDGLTRGSDALQINNPMGYAMMYNHKLKYPISFREKFNCACQSIAMSIYGKNPGYIFKSNNLPITLLALPLGALLSVRRCYQYRKGEK